MKEIKLTEGKIALVDDADFEWLNQFKWCAYKSCHTFYACRSKYLPNGKRRPVQMHREILGLSYGDGIQVDHADGNGLHNFRSNLRVCNASQNSQNRRRNKNMRRKVSQYKGVRLAARGWWAEITAYHVRYFFGYFDTEKGAALGYDIAALKLHGDFARLNFPKIRNILKNISMKINLE